jgi:hypothetical protein
VHIEHTVTTISWIPSDSLKGMLGMSEKIRMAHHDQPPPDTIGNPADEELDALRLDDRYRFANQLRAWVEVDDQGAVTSAGESSSPHGVRFPNEPSSQPLRSVRPLLATSRPAPSYTQWRGKADAPTRAPWADPSVRTVSSRVVHTVGARYWTNGGCFTARGMGRPVRPP